MNIPAPDASPDSGPDFDLRAYLRGSWSVDRTLLDRRTGTRGTFTGVVRFTDDDDGGLRWREEGTVRWTSLDGAPFTGPGEPGIPVAARRHGPVMDVAFPDGRPFHRMGFTGQSNQDVHWCDPDTYRVTYTVLGPDECRLPLGRHRSRQGPAARVGPAPAGRPRPRDGAAAPDARLAG